MAHTPSLQRDRKEDWAKGKVVSQFQVGADVVQYGIQEFMGETTKPCYILIKTHTEYLYFNVIIN